MVRRRTGVIRGEGEQDNVPLSPPVYHVLLALGENTLHGYAIMRAFEDLTNGEEHLLPGTLYATISRMVDAGLIEEAAPPDPGADARRRYYRVTPLGREVAADESARIRLLLDVAIHQGIQVERSK